jgi:PAS domain S-box-containing protein
MSQAFQVLIVEDSESDAALVVRALQRGGLTVASRRVESAVELRAALEARSWDVVIADYRLPGFDAPEALALVRRSGRDIPFIVVSGFIGEEIAVEMMRAGAHDYIMKNNLARLAPTVEREVRESAERRERRVAEEALRESEARYRLLAENGGDVVWTLEEPTGIFTYVSPSVRRLLGRCPVDLLAEPLSTVLHPDSRERVLRLVRERLDAARPGAEQGRLHIDKVDMLRADGSVVTTEMAVTVREDAAGRRDVLGVSRDVTERVQLEAQLLHAQKMEAVGQLAGGVAHDFNNLLQAIQGFAQLTHDGLPPESEGRLHLEEVLRASERAHSLVSKLLTFGRRERAAPSSVDLRELVEGLATMLRRLLGESWEIVTSGDGAPVSVAAEAEQLEQVIVNLCINAKEAMPGGGEIRVGTARAALDAEFCRLHAWARPGDFAVLTVSDGGTGMPPDVLDHIFEPFYTTKQRGRGTGLGLAIVYGIVKQYDGFFHVRSAPGAGTFIEIYLPLAAAPARTGRGRQRPAEGGTETILLAEDDESVRAFALQVLQNAGYVVLPARDGQEALSVFCANRDSIRIAVLDVIMPRMSGKVVAERIRAMAPDMPVLFSTGYDFRLLEEGFVPAPDVEVLRKPFTYVDLLRAVRGMIDAAAARRP